MDGADRGRHRDRDDTEEPAYCGHCGEPLVGRGGDPQDHAPCVRRLELEPPRYCPDCRRRMVVQVTPRGWTASCSRHGVTTG
ncbi:biotin synthase auxiliary protein BsaP [Kytococcus sedentarius]